MPRRRPPDRRLPHGGRGRRRRQGPGRPGRDHRFDHIQDIEDIPTYRLEEIAHFFARYKDLEKGKYVKGHEWAGKDEAERIVTESIERFKAEGHPNEAHEAAGAQRGDLDS